MKKFIVHGIHIEQNKYTVEVDAEDEETAIVKAEELVNEGDGYISGYLYTEFDFSDPIVEEI